MTIVRRLRDREFNGYLRRRIPHPLDDVVDEVVAAYRDGSPETRREMESDLTERVAGVLSVYGERMAAVAVRSRSPEPLRRGLVGMGMADAALDDDRMNLIVLAAVHHSAETIGTDLATVIDDVADELPESALERFRAFTRRPERSKSLHAMGLGTMGAGDTFRYTWG
jgi:hypothetical protein